MSDGVKAIRVHRESLEGVDSNNQIPNIDSILVEHDNGLYKYTVKTIQVDPLDSDAFYLTVKPAHGTIPTGSATSAVIFQPYSQASFKNSDYNALFNNATDVRDSKIFTKVDRASGQIVPSNLGAITSNALAFTDIQDSNYSSKAYTNIRYEGSLHTANNFNKLSSDTGLKPVEKNQSYFGYFSYLGGTSPEWGNHITDRTGAKLKYIIGLDGKVVTPSEDVDGINLSNIRQNFIEDNNIIIDLDSVTNPAFNTLNGSHTVFKSGKRVEPILYSQTASYDINDNVTGFGYSNEITFFSSDIQNSDISSDMAFSARPIGSQVIGKNTVPFTVEFFDITNGTHASYNTGDDYILLEPADTNEPFVITVDAHIKVDRNTLYRFNTTYEIQKSTNGGSSWSIIDSQTVNHDDTQYYSASIQDSITDTSGTDTFAYRLRVSTLDKHNSATNVEIEPGLSWIKFTQSPKSATSNKVSSNYWVVDSGDRYYISGSTDLSSFYGDTQNDIEDSGFNTINYPFEVHIGDEIRFQASEIYSYRIEEIVQEQPQVILRLDKPVQSGVNEDFFLLRRYVDDPTSVLLEVDKKAGATSGGVLKPEYMPSGSEVKIQTILKELKEKNQI